MTIFEFDLPWGDCGLLDFSVKICSLVVKLIRIIIVISFVVCSKHYNAQVVSRLTLDDHMSGLFAS